MMMMIIMTMSLVCRSNRFRNTFLGDTRVLFPNELSDSFRVQGDMTTLVTEGRSEMFSSVCKKVEYD